MRVAHKLYVTSSRIVTRFMGRVKLSLDISDRGIALSIRLSTLGAMHPCIKLMVKFEA